MSAAIAATRVASTDDSPNTPVGVVFAAAVVVFTGLIISDDSALVGKRSPEELPNRLVDARSGGKKRGQAVNNLAPLFSQRARRTQDLVHDFRWRWV